MMSQTYQEEYRRKLELQYKDKLEEMAVKREEPTMIMKELKLEIFKIDTEIYGIRCFLGETIEFTKLRSGEGMPIDEPVVLYQRMRFLDEELGRHLSIYGVGDSCDDEYFESILKYRDDIVDVFCPNDKCISVIRLSEHELGLTPHPEWNNMLKRYEKLHGTKIGILLCYVRFSRNCRE